MVKNIPRPEYPRPQLVRKDWINLNGTWEFEIDHGRSGKDRKLYKADCLSGQILVPFCPESKLSGVENKDFMAAVWYRRGFEIPENWRDGHVLIHFGAVDYNTEVWINDVSVGTHKGGYTPFSFDITSRLVHGTNVVTVYAEDDNRTGLQPRGKQSGSYYSAGCDYTRTTGIWQTVWLEFVPQTYISSLKLIPDPDNSCVQVNLSLAGENIGYELEATAFFSEKNTGSRVVTTAGNYVSFELPLSEIHLWGPGEPNLYDLKLSVKKDGRTIDAIESYFGLRTITTGKNAILINGKAVFQRLVLDQGFYPDGVYTAPSDEDLKRDIEISMELGFNGARMHQKVFEPGFIYWADKLGYLVWGEYASWGLDVTTSAGLEIFLPEWMEAVERDYNHPSIVGWCPFNETWDKGWTWGPNGVGYGSRQDDEVLRAVYNVTKAMDHTRPVIDTSGNFHVITDIFDIHDYEQNVEKFAAKFEPMKSGGEVYVTWADRQKYEGQPYFVSEYGGTWWNPEQKDEGGWGYGNRPASVEEVLERYEGLTGALLDNPNICAFCYTQLYDIEQEQNGLYTYDRGPKFDVKIIRSINLRKAAIEE